MGVKGFSFYINQRSKYLHEHKLYNTNIVVDGNSLMFHVFNSNKCSFHFGGDYDEFAFYLNDFFDQLIACNVVPLIIIDGAKEDIKINTIISRVKENFAMIKTIQNSRKIMMPLLTKEVLKHVAKSKNIACVQSTFEADNVIASVARIINCPVLSFDSDFCFYNIDYIPFDTLDSEISFQEDKFVKNCKIYRCKYLLNSFGIRSDVLPLAAILLGNDYISAKIFQKFFLTLKVSKKCKEKLGFNKPRLRIEAVFQWLAKQKSLDHAIAQILPNVDNNISKLVLERIELILNRYLNTSTEILCALGFTLENIDLIKETIPQKLYKFQAPQEFEFKLEKKPDEVYLQNDDLKDLSFQDTHIFQPVKTNNLNKLIPPWFMYEYNIGNYPSHFIDIIIRQLIISSAQVEDCTYPTCFNISLKIISVIFKLLCNGSRNCDILKYIARGSDIEIKQYELDVKNYYVPYDLPKLEKLVRLSKKNKKQIFDLTLGVSGDKTILEFPPSWRLYIVIIKYWLKEADEKFKTKYHLYSLIFVMLLHVLKKTIINGNYFQQMYSAKKDENLRGEATQIHVPLTENMSVEEALKNLNIHECLFIKPFFDPLHLANYNEFDLSIIHAFTLLQNAMKSSMHLNSLLGYPYTSLDPAEFFNGTLNYNLYKHFKKYPNLNQCIIEILRNTPTILQLFVSIVTKFGEVI